MEACATLQFKQCPVLLIVLLKFVQTMRISEVLVQYPLKGLNNKIIII